MRYTKTQMSYENQSHVASFMAIRLHRDPDQRIGQYRLIGRTADHASNQRGFKEDRGFIDWLDNQFGRLEPYCHN